MPISKDANKVDACTCRRIAGGDFRCDLDFELQVLSGQAVVLAPAMLAVIHRLDENRVICFLGSRRLMAMLYMKAHPLKRVLAPRA